MTDLERLRELEDESQACDEAIRLYTQLVRDAEEKKVDIDAKIAALKGFKLPEPDEPETEGPSYTNPDGPQW